MLLTLWVLFGLPTFWISAYWVLRAVVRRGPVVGAAFGAGTFIFLIPPISAGEALSLFPLYPGVSVRFEWLAILGELLPVVVLAAIVTLFLHGFSRIAGTMLTPEIADNLYNWTRPRNLLLLAFVIVWPLVMGLDGTDSGISDLVLQLMTLFQAYGATLALVAPLGLILFLAKTGDPDRNPFSLPAGVPLLLAAAFSGYLTLWQREPMSVLVLMAAGWFVFYYGVLGPQPAEIAARASNLGRRLLDFRKEIRLIETRGKNMEKKFSDGEMPAMDLANHRVMLRNLAKRAGASLGFRVAEAKRQLLEWGPGNSPVENGVLGAKVGLFAAAAFQLLHPFDFTSEGDSTEVSAGWLTLLRAVVVDPNYQLVTTVAGESQLLVFVNALLNAVALWVIAGFLFGYAFHRIRGDDGFVKAVTFGVGISIPYLLSRALLADEFSILPLGLDQLVPLLLFLLVLGALVFDGKTLRKEGISLVNLPEVYGLRTSLGYASFAGLLASAQPLLQFIDALIR